MTVKSIYTFWHKTDADAAKILKFELIVCILRLWYTHIEKKTQYKSTLYPYTSSHLSVCRPSTVVNCVWNIQKGAHHQACNVIRKQLRAYTAVSATHKELSKGERSIVMTVSVCLWAYPWNYSVSPKTSTLCFWITLIFGVLNFEKIWRENLRDLSISPVRCSQWRPYRWCKWCGAPGPTTLGGPPARTR